MLELDSLYRDLDRIGLAGWCEDLAPLLAERLAPSAHGHLEAWKNVVLALPAAQEPCVHSVDDAVEIRGPHLAHIDRETTRQLLMKLNPWRKGPFRIQDIELDAEWRSDLKWNRVISSIDSLDSKAILDVGCGNGYYAFRMLGEGATCVVGIDPTLLFVCQFAAIKRMSGVTSAHVLPLRLHELPSLVGVFDATFSMGVIYHQREPLEHLGQLRQTLRPGGQLILETLVLPGDELDVLQPVDRYARMRNVWHVPTVAALTTWLREVNFKNIRIVDVSVTATTEQRSTEWMPFESLAESLHPNDPTQTIEGLPGPRRALVVCTAP